MSIKDVHCRELSSDLADKTRGFLRRGRLHFSLQKSSDFSKFMVRPHEQGRLSQRGHSADKWGEVNFSRFCADVFYGQLLTIFPLYSKLFLLTLVIFRLYSKIFLHLGFKD